jgi:hypothetical protein
LFSSAVVDSSKQDPRYPNPRTFSAAAAAYGTAEVAMAAVATVSSASGLLAMLQEPAPELKLHALASLNSVVHLFWPEISTSVPTM